MESLRENMVCGWSTRQWAIAAEWFGSVYGWMPLPTLAGANLVMNGWWNRREAEPSRIVQLVDERGRPLELAANMKWARKMFLSAALECRVIGFGDLSERQKSAWRNGPKAA